MDKHRSSGNDASLEQGLQGRDDKTVRIAAEQEQDVPSENTSFGSNSGPNGDDYAENKVATSLDGE